MNVTRNRVVKAERRFFSRTQQVSAVAAGLALAVSGGVAYATTVGFGQRQVGSEYADGLQISSDQVLQPLGDRTMTPYGKFMGSTVSPDGRFLAATSTDRGVSLQVFDLATNQLVWRGGSASGVNAKLADNTVGQEGPLYSPDGKVLWMPNATGLTRFPVNPDGSLGSGTKVSIPSQGDQKALTSGLAYSADGATLYAGVNGQNTVVAIDPAAGTITHTWDVGIAPRQLKLVGTKLYVSDEGGRRAVAGDATQGSYGTDVPADPVLGTSTTGVLSTIDTAHPSAPVGQVKVGLHPTAMYAKGSVLYVANTNDDTVSVVDTTTDAVVQTVSTQPWQGSKVGYEPDAVAVQNGRLLVSLGRANAIAVYRLGQGALDPVRYVGLVPTDYYPEEVTPVGDQLVVTNRRGIDARGPLLTFNAGYGTTPATGHGTHGTTASLTRFTLPSDSDIKETWTPTVFHQNGWGDANTDVKHASGSRARAVPVPKRIGDPSTIKHVFMVVKENRTYDQIHGDMPEGNGDASLAQFGEQVTPNIHALARQFGLYDNTYDIGTNSAEGHNWIMQGDDPEYTESSAGEYTRSYDTEEDVLGHQRSGFLWTAIQAAGHSARNYGEFLYTEGKPSGSWQQYYCASKSVEDGGDPAQLTSPELKGDYGSVIPSLNDITNPTSPPFDLSIPDLYRYQIWKQDFLKFGPADFNMLWMSDDHTGGPVSARSEVAGGDVALGKVVQTISHSPYWKNSAIFVVEDDSQNGADHVDGHRAPIQVISPWAAHGKTVSTYYSQISMVRTIEQILGAEPLNQKVAAATPMFDAFQATPDQTPFTARPNRISLTENIATPPSCGLDTPSSGAAAAAPVPAKYVAYQQAWQQWAAKQHLTGAHARPDFANPEQMNRFTWYDAHNWGTPYPGDPQIYLPQQVPGAALPGSDTD
ncbi:bifunctional YncE family protein/alkaline phosphatase family protein [Nocardioides sp. LS1]|uniref:bifunctional YncE family protein/alkaline phosphatase family protein n=1 Tax=Nocardioides sp. LS1 TaxID=1027620 RepID=UPI000F61DBFA|nr:bifunctional YncE family protein/alkaline phosphatase family protein [Nocardioides sp. LS1]GCD91563.1 phosphoesterase [Nocardioides sp. LS1]